jgi:hypothetical protein
MCTSRPMTRPDVVRDMITYCPALFSYTPATHDEPLAYSMVASLCGRYRLPEPPYWNDAAVARSLKKHTKLLRAIHVHATATAPSYLVAVKAHIPTRGVMRRLRVVEYRQVRRRKDP